MIENDKQLPVTLVRVRRMQELVAHLRRTESTADNYSASVSGFISEIDRMQLEVREYLTIYPGEIAVH